MSIGKNIFFDFMKMSELYYVYGLTNMLYSWVKVVYIHIDFMFDENNVKERCFVACIRWEEKRRGKNIEYVKRYEIFTSESWIIDKR